jgi:hypothetical protein
MLDKLASSDFSALLDEQFEIHAGDLQLDAALVEVVDLEPPRGRAAGRTRPFSILLRAAGEPALPQGTYSLRHPGIGALELFLVPIGTEEGDLLYEAVFN